MFYGNNMFNFLKKWINRQSSDTELDFDKNVNCDINYLRKISKKKDQENFNEYIKHRNIAFDKYSKAAYTAIYKCIYERAKIGSYICCINLSHLSSEQYVNDLPYECLYYIDYIWENFISKELESKGFKLKYETWSDNNRYVIISWEELDDNCEISCSGKAEDILI